MAITKDEVKKIAELARIELTAAEEERYAETISAVLKYMEILNEVNTDAVEPTFQVTGLTNVVRADVVLPASDEVRSKLLKQMPAVEMEELVVPEVFNGE